MHQAANGIRAVFFDAGFTLLEPVKPIADLYIEGAAELGISLDRTAFREHLAGCWVGHSKTRGQSPDLRTSEEDEFHGWHLFTTAVATPFPALLERHREWLALLRRRFDHPDCWRPFARIHELLDTLKGRGLILGVISNWHAILHPILSQHGLSGYFDFVLVSAEFGWRKPHARIFTEGLRLAGTTATETVHVGDSLTDDVHGARAVGIRPILVSPQPPEEGLPPQISRISGTTRLLEALDVD